MSKKVGILASLIIISLLLLQNNAYDQIPLDLENNLSTRNNVCLSAETSWLSGWNYRKSHNITAGMDAGENFQMSFIIYYGSGLDSDTEVYCQTHCRSDFGDLRFTSSNGVTEYDYWIQNCTTGVQALFWVEITEKLNISRTMYIYYGRPTSTTTSNGTATFRFFEDFSRPDSATVGNGWFEDENQTHVSISNEALNVSGATHRYAHIERPLSEGANLVLEGNIYVSSNETGDLANAICLYWSDHVWIRAGWSAADGMITLTPTFFSQENEGTGASTGGHSIPWETGNKWYRFRIMLGYTARSLHSLDDGYTWEMIPYSTTRPAAYSEAPTYIILGRGYSNNPTGSCPNPDLDNHDPYETYSEANSYIDDVFIRNYCVYVPHHDDYSSEEINPIVDTTLPVLSHPDDVTFEEGATGYELTWTLTDENPHNYTVWKQDELYDFGNWDTSPMEVTVSLDGVTEGVYIFSMVALDDYINLNFDQVIVNVTAATITTTTTTTTSTNITSTTTSSNTSTDGTTVAIPSILTIGISVGSAIIILVIVVLIFKQEKPS
ncbi:MAG: DUF2341 domain-containing protein [Candidatus Thorarchaeota archaeon]